MAYVITPGCCSDASCVAVCPVNCIHPTPDEPDFGTTASLFVDPATCIDCGACADACPVDAIGPADALTGADTAFIQLNRDFYRDAHRAAAPRPQLAPRFPATLPHDLPQPRVAIVGTGPAASYTADLLLRSVGAEVTMFDRLPVPGGLLRYGVAPDHPSTRRLGERFTGFLNNPQLHMMLGLEIGTDVSTAELAEHFDAVVYAVGASTSRDLDIPGEQLPGSTSATQFVAWYNGHPDAGYLPHGLDSERAVIIGNGNVALDVARILLSDPDRLAGTDIADAALLALRSSRVREVVVSARRGPQDASYTMGELHAIRNLPDIDLLVADGPAPPGGPDLADSIDTAPAGSHTALLAGLPVTSVDWARPPAAGKRIVLQFRATPVELAGTDELAAVTFAASAVPGSPAGAGGVRTSIPAGLAIRAIGYRGRPLAGLPFDENSRTVPNRVGRVLDASGEPIAGQYVVGWIKRGARGGIGANRQDANETVAALVEDIIAGRLPRSGRSARGFRSRLARRFPSVIDRAGVLAIDAAERSSGEAAGRPRVKLTSREDLVAAARGRTDAPRR